MYSLIYLTSASQTHGNSTSRSPWRRGFLLCALPLAFAGFALSPAARAVSPAPDGGYAGENTAEGDFALESLTSGTDNTALGFIALLANTSGSFNTATGAGALYRNTAGNNNTAAGFDALFNNTFGNDNTANGVNALVNNTGGGNNTAAGFDALFSNTTGGANTANGAYALNNNTTGDFNTANGYVALSANNTGSYNTADGVFALRYNNTGGGNTANGYQALNSNTTGNDNTASGQNALLRNTTGSTNIALGTAAGSKLTTGNNNIMIGAGVEGAARDANKIRIGNKGTQTATYIAGIYGKTVASATGVGVKIDANGKLGTVLSSARYKQAIKPMDKASEALLALEPVTFRYKDEIDPDGIPQFGLIAEQVEKVDPNLVVRDEEGKVSTVRYEAVNAMLLNEFLKDYRKGQEQDAMIAQLKSEIAQQQQEIKALTGNLKDQALQIEKMSARIAAGRATPRVVVND